MNKDSNNKERVTKKESKNKKNTVNRKISKKVWIPLVSFLFLVVLVAGIALHQLSNIVTIAGGDGGFDRDMERINMLVLGIDEKAGLSDTIMLISFDKEKEEMAMISIPRDLWVDVPNTARQAKINAIYAEGERVEEGRGIEYARKTAEDVTGVDIDRVIVMDTNAFVEIVDIMDGVEITREEPFVEGLQWHGSGTHNSDFWHIATRQIEVEVETNDSSDEEENEEPRTQTVTRQFWVFSVPEGTHTLNGRDALYYARSRHSSSDFDRAARQQEIIESLKSEIMSAGMLRNPSRILEVYRSVERNIETDISLAEIRELLSMARNYSDINANKAVLDTSEDGLLVSSRSQQGSYILLPRAGNFSEIHEYIQNMFESKEEYNEEEDIESNTIEQQ